MLGPGRLSGGAEARLRKRRAISAKTSSAFRARARRQASQIRDAVRPVRGAGGAAASGVGRTGVSGAAAASSGAVRARLRKRTAAISAKTSSAFRARARRQASQIRDAVSRAGGAAAGSLGRRSRGCHGRRSRKCPRTGARRAKIAMQFGGAGCAGALGRGGGEDWTPAARCLRRVQFESSCVSEHVLRRAAGRRGRGRGRGRRRRRRLAHWSDASRPFLSPDEAKTGEEYCQEDGSGGADEDEGGTIGPRASRAAGRLRGRGRRRRRRGWLGTGVGFDEG